MMSYVLFLKHHFKFHWHAVYAIRVCGVGTSSQEQHYLTFLYRW